MVNLPWRQTSYQQEHCVESNCTSLQPNIAIANKHKCYYCNGCMHGSCGRPYNNENYSTSRRVCSRCEPIAARLGLEDHTNSNDASLPSTTEPTDDTYLPPDDTSLPPLPHLTDPNDSNLASSNFCVIF